MRNLFNIEYRKVGGLRFIFIGRITLMWCVSSHSRWAESQRQAHGYVATIDA